jgi:predicted RNase H-like HicB family nuclease
MNEPRAFSVVLIPQAEGGYFIRCPALLRCYRQGKTVGECLANIREAIELALEDVMDCGRSIT